MKRYKVHASFKIGSGFIYHIEARTITHAAEQCRVWAAVRIERVA